MYLLYPSPPHSLINAQDLLDRMFARQRLARFVIDEVRG
jgi:hypothetical protein